MFILHEIESTTLLLRNNEQKIVFQNNYTEH